MERIRERRNGTAREAAEHFGVTERTIRYHFAEPREEFLSRAQEKQAAVLKLRATGMKYKDIAAELNLPVGTVGTCIKKAKKEGILEQKIIIKKPRKKETKAGKVA